MRGRKPLTPDQSAKLKHVADADDAWRKAKKYEYKRARKEAEERIAQYSMTRDKAVFDAVQAGVPKVTVGRDGLGTSNPHAVNEAYDRVRAIQKETGVLIPEAPGPRFRWGAILAVDERWVYGWVLDSENPDVQTGSGLDPAQRNYGFFVVVDRVNEVVTTIYTPGGVLTTADPGWDDVRAWAAVNAKQAEGEQNAV